ncbi:MAG: flippase-like domain-containing protein, partial [Acidobacteria bacterium]|nr:flippase-like domain-containing protein [Acidobacteriota bacterium]
GRLPGAGAFALERLMDLAILSSMAAIGLVFGDFAARFAGWKAAAAVLAILALLALCVLLFFDPGGRAALLLAQLRRGTSSKTWPQMAFLTILSWVLVAVNWQISLSAVQIHLALSQVLLLVSLVTIGAVLSFIPGGLGLSAVVTTAILTNMGIVAVTAQAGAVVLHAYGLIVVAFGLVHLGLWPIYGIYSDRYLAANKEYTEAATLVAPGQEPRSGSASQEF